MFYLFLQNVKSKAITIFKIEANQILQNKRTESSGGIHHYLYWHTMQLIYTYHSHEVSDYLHIPLQSLESCLPSLGRILFWKDPSAYTTEISPITMYVLYAPQHTDQCVACINALSTQQVR